MSWTKASIDDVKARARVEDVIGRETKLKKDGDDVVGCCCLPGHKDDTPSLRVSTKKQVWRCHGCGRGGGVVDFVMVMRGCSFPEAMRVLADDTGVALVDEAPAKAQLVAKYDYQGADGATLYTIERWEPGREGRSKGFVQRLPDGTAKKCAQQVLFRLPAVVAAVDANETVFVCEGEKAALAVIGLGLCATTHAGGASAIKTWTPEFAEPLKGARVVLLPDHDDVGANLMRHVAGVLKGIAREVRTLALPVANKGDDAVEWIAGGGTREKLDALCAAQPAQAEQGAWREQLRFVGRYLVGSAANLELILEHDPALVRLVAFDRFANRVMLLRAPPWGARASERFPRPIDDHDVTRLRIHLERVYGVAFADVGPVLGAVADKAGFNPLTDWLSSLKWDGKPRLATWLVRLLGAADTRYTRAVGRAWPISAVARAFDPGVKVDHTPVLEGVQGTGKSSAIRALVGSDWFLDHLPDFTSKDAAILVARAWVHELAELATLSRAEVEKIKQFLAQQLDVYRPPYGKQVVDVPRKCVFIATTNRDDYLKDVTGNRRFWPIVTTRIDLAGITAEREQLWAEAVAAYRAGEAFDFRDADVRAAAEAEQEERLEHEPWADRISIFCEAHASKKLDDKKGFVFLEEVLGAVGVPLERQSAKDSGRCRAVLRKLRWEEKRPRWTENRRRIWVPPGWADDEAGPSGPGGPSGGQGSGPTAERRSDAAGPMVQAENAVSSSTPTTSGTPAAARAAQADLHHSLNEKPLGPLGPLGPMASGSAGKWSKNETPLLGPGLDQTIDDIFGAQG